MNWKVQEINIEPKGEKYTFTYKCTTMGSEGLPITIDFEWCTHANSLHIAYLTFSQCHETGTYVSRVVVEKQEFVVFGE